MLTKIYIFVKKNLHKKAVVVLTTAIFLSIFTHVNNNSRGNTMNEYIPNGYRNWTEYNRAQEKKAKRNYILQGIGGMLVFFGAIVLDSVTSLYM